MGQHWGDCHGPAGVPARFQARLLSGYSGGLRAGASNALNHMRWGDPALNPDSVRLGDELRERREPEYQVQGRLRF